MATRFNLREQLETPEVKRFESTHSNRPLADIPIKNFVDVTTGLLQTKVAATFIRGALDEAGFWQELINVFQLSAPIEKVPVISQRDFVVRTGKMARAALEESGGRLTEVTLDTTNEDKIRYAYLQINEQSVKARNFDFIEKSIEMAGRAFSKKILSDITSHYISVAGNSQALGGDKYFVALLKAINLNKTDGFGCTAIIADSTDFLTQAIVEETTGGTMPWLAGVQNGQPLGDNFSKGAGLGDGTVGFLFGRMPIYLVSNDSGLSGNIIAVDVPAASVLGFAPGGDFVIKDHINTMHDLIEAKITAKYDYKNANANAVAKVTGA